MISVLIPVYDYSIQPILSSLYEAAQKAKIPFEIIFMDDASPNKKQSTLNQAYANQYSHTQYLIADKNLGRAQVRNALAAQATFEYLLFLDVDAIIPSPDFIQVYENHKNEADVLIGGTVYAKNTDPQFALRYKYGLKREAVSACKRALSPYSSLSLNNLFIRKSTYSKIKLDESFKSYGHEDTKFGYELEKQSISVLHIENPVQHTGLENNQTFLKKSEIATLNFVKLVKEGLGKESKLFKTHNQLRKLGLLPVFDFLYPKISYAIQKNLKSAHPSLFLFDLYKLSIFSKAMKEMD